MGGDAIRAMAGSLTINGGYFEGRGLSGYSSNRNEVIYASVDMSSVVINDGHFNGRSGADAVWAETLINAGRFTVNGGIFELDKNAATIGVVYRSYTYATSDSGIIGVSFPNASPNTLYYYKEKSNSNYIEAPYDSVKSDEYSYFRLSKVYQVYVEPKQGHRTDSGLSIDPTSDVAFLYQGKKLQSTDDINWRVGDSMKVYVDPESLYFEDQNASAYGVTQSLSSTVRFDLKEYISDSNQPIVLQNQSAALSKDSSGYYIDLNTLSSTVKSKLTSGKTYCFAPTVTENWKSRREFNIWHSGSFLVTIGIDIDLFGCEITEPAYGQKPSDEAVYSDVCYDVTLKWLERMTTGDMPQDMDTSTFFKRDRLYTAYFIVTMKNPYTRADEFSFYVNGKKVENTTKMTYGFVALVEYDMRVDPIGMVQLNDVPEPVNGEYAMRSYTVPEDDNYRVKAQTGGGYQMYWYKENGATLQPSDKFEGGKKYKLRVNIETTDGYEFVDTPTVLINGHFATLKSSFDNRELTVEYTFDCPIAVTTIGALSVTVPLPEAGKALGYTASVPEGFGYEVEDYGDGSDWKDGVKWVDSNGNNLPIGTKAEAGKSYTAWVSLKINDTDLYQFAPADEVTAYMNDKDAEVYEYDEYNYGVYCTFTVGESSGSYMIGDADTDEKISILDATAIQRVLASLSVAAFNEKAADADEDTKLTILDATAIQRHLAALSTNPNSRIRLYPKSFIRIKGLWRTCTPQSLSFIRSPIYRLFSQNQDFFKKLSVSATPAAPRVN